jgi:hypothetical protein
MFVRAGSLALFLLASLLAQDPARAAVSVVVGTTPIPDGEAVAARDITLLNEHVAIALAVESTAPYGVPRGSIVDVAAVVNDQPGRDRVEFADFIPDNWSAWPSTYQKVEVLEQGPLRAVVRSTRDWGKVTIASTYTLRAGADRVELRTTMTNTGDSRLTDLQSGQTLWPSGACYFLPVPGLGDVSNAPATGALARRSAIYDEDWIITLHAPYLDYVGDGGSYDLFQAHALDPGQSRTFEAWLQVGTRGELGPTLAAEIELGRLASGRLRGNVMSREGKPVEEPVIVMMARGHPYAWIGGRDGRYEATLPVGDYELYATAKGHTESARVAVRIAADATTILDFDGLEPPGRVEFDVRDAKTGAPLDARIAIAQGQRPVIGYLGGRTYFTELDRKGRVETALAPGRYEFAVTSGGSFLARREDVQLEVRSGATTSVPVRIERLFDPASSGWYSADLHHHSDQAEGCTPPEYLARAQLAAGLDLLFVSDHDSTGSHQALQAIAERRDLPFVPSIELSPSWAHFNAWPLRPGEKMRLDTSTASVDEVFAEARRLGAIVLQANHPFNPYGYLTNAAAGVVPGKFNSRFELFEVNVTLPGDDAKVLNELWRSWSSEQRYYLAGGTDVHDVWSYESGQLRTYAKVAGDLTPQSYAEAVKAGRAYVSNGPLIEPGLEFGTELKVTSGARFVLPFTLRSVAGLRRVALIGAGRVVDVREFPGAPFETQVEFERAADGTRWYSIEVEDAAGRKAYTNPIWIDEVEPPKPAS